MACYNEEENVNELYRRLNDALNLMPQYDYKLLFIDNSSEDKTVEKLTELAKQDSRITIIVNNRNFGHIRSPYWGLLQSQGDATICMASDLQDPPELIHSFIEEWEKGWKIVLATKPTSQTNFLVHFLRKKYYEILDKISTVKIIKNTTGFGIYDRVVIQHIQQVNDPYPYIRGLVSELGFPIKTIDFKQPKRFAGISSNNIYSLYDMALLGIVNHSVVPIRFATFFGFICSIISFLIAIYYLVMKILNWNTFPLGVAPLVIGMFFFFSIQLIFLGILGEYVISIQRSVRKLPVVTEKERIHFDNHSNNP